MIEFILPTSIVLPRKTKDDKRVSLNLNNYRNQHHREENTCKKLFRPLKIELFRANKIRVSYHIEKMSKRKYDLGNIFAIVDKYFLDWLTAKRMIPDDNLFHVEYGSITGSNNCKENRVLAYITILEEMK